MSRLYRFLSALLCLLLLAAPTLSEGARPTAPRALPDGPLNPGARGSGVLLLQQALLGLGYLPDTSGVYGRATITALAAFQKDRGLTATGRADRASLRLLFLKPGPQEGDTLLPYWYGGGSELIPWGAEFEVKDVRSGLTFTARRMMGTSHLDAEPVTSHDTFEMQKAYGGKWRWDRRPILLRYRNLVIAASMNGMPHSYDFNRMNAMDGHFCIHFFGSRIDGNQRIDDAHVQAVMEASFTRWEDGPTQP